MVVLPLPPDTLLQPELPFADCCHWIFPEFPLSVRIVVPLLAIEVVDAVAVPPTEEVTTVTAPETALVVLQSLVLVMTQ
jgi:hypothetical protein